MPRSSRVLSLLRGGVSRPLSLSRPSAALYSPASSPARLYSTAPPTKPKHASPKPPKDAPPDHRQLAVQQQLFTTSIYSPGSPLFLPNGTRIFNRLVDFLRRQYVYYGFDEVITPTIYKKSLWEKSGHLANYADDMYSVTGASHASHACCDHDSASTAAQENADDGEFGLKPMNCPGHCLIFASQTRSYRDLPIRYADFSPLHRNEISGALSGLTRVRRFHQDDGHIFCRPSQVEREISRTLEFVSVAYGVLRIDTDYRLALSTRPETHFIGTEEEWMRAEAALRRALDASGRPWTVKEGDGAFYGPKIDVIIRDSDGKEHQTATIQLDFQMPKRFELEYQAPAPDLEARGETTTDPALLAHYGPVTPVLIHRAVLGSVERLMALLIEKHAGRWPFWLNPRQAIVLTVKDTPDVVSWAQTVHDTLEGHEGNDTEQNPHRRIRRSTGLAVDMDTRAESLGKKVREAREKGYGLVIVVGPDDVSAGKATVMGQDMPADKPRAQMTPGELLGMMKDMVETFQ